MRRLLRVLRALMSEEPIPISMDANLAKNPSKVLDETLLHAKEGYRNTQEVIKFVDTKTAVVTGLSTLIAGALAGVIKWSIEADGETRANLAQITGRHVCLAAWFYVFVGLSLAAALLCIGAAVWSVIARSRPKNLENNVTVLFPIYRQRDSTAACKTIERKLKGMTKIEMLSEYEDQLRVVGMIVGKKLKHIRLACFALLAQLLCFVIAGALLTTMYVRTRVNPHRHSRLVIVTEKARDDILSEI